MTVVPPPSAPPVPLPAAPADPADPSAIDSAGVFAALVAALAPELTPGPPVVPAAVSAPVPDVRGSVVDAGVPSPGTSTGVPAPPVAADPALTELPAAAIEPAAAAARDPEETAPVAPPPVGAPPRSAPDVEPATAAGPGTAIGGIDVVATPVTALATAVVAGHAPARDEPGDGTSPIVPPMASAPGAVPAGVPPNSAVATPAPVRGDAQLDRPPAPAPPPHAQIVAVVAPLRRRPDGIYRLGLQLEPEQLGRVRVDVELGAGEVHLRLHADDHAAQALRDALPELRSSLQAAGLRPGALDVDGGGAGPFAEHHAERGQAPRSREDARPLSEPAPPVVPSSPPPGSGALDVHL